MEHMPKGKTPILVIDDDEGLLMSIKATIASSGIMEPALLSDSRRALELIRKHDFHLVILDLIMPHMGGIEILEKIKEEFPAVECVIVTAVDDTSSAVQAMKFGAYDYLVKPLNSEKLIITITRALERYNLRNKLTLFEQSQTFSDLRDAEAFKEMVSADKAMALVFHQAEVAAPTDYNVVITGESGTGKEMLARIIHQLSHRAEGPFVAVNMAAFNRTLFEDDFFGHVKGAYTGALREKKGFFEESQGGTLFLDEITELETGLQGKLLRVVQERELYRLGSSKTKDIDIRIISATNRDMKQSIKEGLFREDLFYRLNMFHINIPPLRERKGDIVPLARHFMKKHAGRNGKKIMSISSDFTDLLLRYSFPGNVRELEHIIAKAVLLEEGNTLTVKSNHDLYTSLQSEDSKEGLLTLEEVERRHIDRVLESTGNNRTHAARILGIGLRTLQRKIKTPEG